MPAITVYTTPFCPYCFMAKRLLTDRGVAFEEIDVMMHPKRRGEMVGRAGGRTSVPQIFIGDTHVGGCDDLIALDGAGKLDALLQQEA
ncbi:MAG: glutaredoxin 3 [Inquilinus sp.]|nr:glutaredoxin 3 [Inquilinus sp.]